MNNLRFAFRQLRKAPAFTLTALATVAICLGANLAIFAVINSILLRPLPFPQSDRLVTIFNTYPKAGVENDGSSITNYYERRGNIPAFSSLSIFLNRTEAVGEPGSTEQEAIMRVSAEFFPTLGVGLAMGRPFTEADMANDSGVVILTDAFWRQRLNSDPNVLGRDLRVNGIPRKIVGVLPPDFRYPVLRGPPLPAVQDRRGAARAGRAPFRRWRHSNDRAFEAGRDDRRSAIADRRAQYRGREGQSAGENDGRGRLSLAGPFAPCASRALHPSDPLVDAGRRVFSPAHRRASI